jgi:glycosyltransferase involved in cell wall biosynthesis
MQKTFSIITPTYNVKDKIEKTIQSVLNQGGNICEHIIIDGNSTDGTVKIIKRYSEKYPKIIRFISEPDKGIYDAMNKGISLAQGEYLNFQGAGDTLIDNILIEITPYLTHRLEIIYGGVFKESNKWVEGRTFDKFSVCETHMPHQAMLYNKKVFDKIGLYSLKYPIGADHVFNIMCFSDGIIQKQYIDKVIANFEETGISSTGSDGQLVNELYAIIKNNLGDVYADHYKKHGGEFLDLSLYGDKAQVIIIGDNNELKYSVREKLSTRNKRIDILSEFDINEDNIKKIHCLISMYPNIKVIIADIEYESMWELLLSYNVPVEKIMVYTEMRFTRELETLLKDCPEKKQVYVFGSGKGGEATLRYIKNRSQIDILNVIDNDTKKSGKQIQEYTIIEPTNINIKAHIYFIIASVWHREITKQLINMGVSVDKIIIAYL